jgi:PAS domain S-box-containing protein
MNRRDSTSPGQADRRIALSFGAVVLLLSLTAAGVASHLYLRLQSEEEDRLAGAIAAILSESISRVTFSGKHHARLLVEDMLARVPELAYISVENLDGVILAHSDPSQNDSSVSGADRDEAMMSLGTGLPVLSEHVSSGGAVKEVVVTYRGGFDGKTAGFVRAGVQVEGTRQAQQATLYTLLGLVAVLTALAIAAVYFLSRRFGGSMRALGWQLQGILGHAPLGIAISDRNGRMLAHSAELERMAGRADESASLESALALSVPGHAVRELSGMSAEVLAHGLKTEREVSFEAGDSKRSWQVSMFPIARGEDGQTTLTCALIQDITARKLAETSLREGQERYRGIFEGANDAIVIMDGLYCIECNGKALGLLECGMPDIAGKPVMAFSPPTQPDGEDSSGKAFRMVRMTLDGSPQVFEWQNKTLTGKLILTEVSLSVVQMGNKRCIQAIMRDITQRKEAEEQLRQSEERFSTIYELAPDSILITRVSDDSVLSINNAFERTTGFTREEISERSASGLALWEKPERYREFCAALGDLSRVDNFDITVRTKGGHDKYCYMSGQLITLSGEQCALNVIRDVTESVRMKEIMIQTEKMMSVGGLAAGMAHEINNPLGGILQSAQVLSNRLSSDSRANLETAARHGCPLDSIRAFLEERSVFTLLEGIRQAGSRAARIVSNMLEFSRKETSKSLASLPAILDKAVELCANDYDLKKNYDFRKIVIQREYDPELPPVPCTPTQIEQVIMNLLRNAAQAMASGLPGGSPPRITLRATREGGQARLEVADNGPGMDEETRRKAFEPFYTTKSPGAGTGLGLSVSYFIISSGHDGTIRVESAPGQGSAFIIHLPLDASAGQPAAGEPCPPPLAR